MVLALQAHPHATRRSSRSVTITDPSPIESARQNATEALSRAEIELDGVPADLRRSDADDGGGPTLRLIVIRS